jgi:predicted kinase
MIGLDGSCPSVASAAMDRGGAAAEVPVGRLVVITGLPGSGKTTLATALAAAMPAVRMCPDDWMMASGIDLWDATVRGRIERFQLTVALDLLRAGQDVVIEWGVWTRAERDALRDSARAIGAPVELRHVTAPVDELWRRIEARDREGRWGARPIRREELGEWAEAYEEPTAEELATYDPPLPS